jgi:hypothetical protein
LSKLLPGGEFLLEIQKGFLNVSYEPFVERFRDLALKETRSATLAAGNKFGLPADEYGLLELYCNDENCDCRRVMFDVISKKLQKSVAVIAFGWEPATFYQKWYGNVNSPSARIAVNEMTGLHMNSASEQSELAPAILEMVRWLLTNPAYVARIKRHYQLFKETTDPKYFPAHDVSSKPVGKAKRHCPRGVDS